MISDRFLNSGVLEGPRLSGLLIVPGFMNVIPALFLLAYVLVIGTPLFWLEILIVVMSRGC